MPRQVPPLKALSSLRASQPRRGGISRSSGPEWKCPRPGADYGAAAIGGDHCNVPYLSALNLVLWSWSVTSHSDRFAFSSADQRVEVQAHHA